MAEQSITQKAENAIRTADVLGAFSLASDLAVGLQAEHGARSCYIGMQIAGALGLPADERVDISRPWSTPAIAERKPWA